MNRRRRTAPTPMVIWWRGTPAQKVARDGVRTARQRLPDRFQGAITALPPVVAPHRPKEPQS